MKWIMITMTGIVMILWAHRTWLHIKRKGDIQLVIVGIALLILMGVLLWIMLVAKWPGEY